MLQNYKTSSNLTLIFLFLLPLFFIPGGYLDLSVAKTTLIALSTVIISLFFLREIWKSGKLSISWHPFYLVVILLPIVYLISALSSTPSALALFGYNFEVGTFGYILLSSIILIVISIICVDVNKSLKTLSAVFASLFLAIAFVLGKVLLGLFSAAGAASIFGVTFNRISNTIGGWTDLAMATGLLSMLSILALGMIPMRRSLKILFYGVFVVCTALLVVINFPTVLYFTLLGSVLIFIYFVTIDRRSSSDTSEISSQGENKRKFSFLPIILGLLSLILIANPTISSTQGTLGEVIARVSKVSNIEVRPSLSTTLSISKAVLSQGVLLGSGPNTFSQDWLIHKPVNVNTTPFWGVVFPFGIGFIPTQIASTGVVGSILWLLFFLLLGFLGVKAMIKMPESRALRFGIMSCLVSIVYLWTASFFYAPSPVVLTLAFIFSGLFLALLRETNIISSRDIVFSRDSVTRFISTTLIVIVSFGFLTLAFLSLNKTISAIYFNKALKLSNTTGASLDDIESNLNSAIKFAPADIHYVALSKLYFSKAQLTARNTDNSPEVNQKLFQEAIENNIKSAQNAITINPNSFNNWIVLGSIYSALVEPPLSIDGAYESSRLAYLEALKRNPLNPEIPLLLAQLEVNHGDLEAARSYIRESIALKEDYADAYLLLVRIEIQDNRLREAIASAERASLIVPNNPGLHFELGLLKYSNRDYTSALDSFAQAINLLPDYANARYYLGLSLARLGRFEEARIQLESLTTANPGNTELTGVLDKLRAGKSPF